MRHPGVRPLLGLTLLSSLPAMVMAPRPAFAQTAVEAAPAAKTAIASIADGAATLAVGADAGLAIGMELPVRRGDRLVGYIVLVDVKAKSATGRITNADGEVVQTLDIVALPATHAAATPPDAAPPPPPAPSVSTHTDGPSYNESPNDVIPWERWEYMALSSLAADGLIPGYSSREFQASRQFTRGELAQFTATAMINFKAGSGMDRDRVFIDRLTHAFRYQPAVRDAVTLLADVSIPRPPVTDAKPALPRVPGLSVYGGLRYAAFKGNNDVTLTGRVGGVFDVSDKAFVALSINNLHDRTSALPDAFPVVDVATLNFNALDTDWEIGKSYWSSGPVHSGDGLLSDNSPGLYMVKGRKAFSWGKFPGKFVYTQMYGGFKDFGRTKYYGLRRLESNIGPRVTLGLGESYVSTKAPGPLSLILPYYAYQKVKDPENSSFNYMAQIDIVGRVNRNLNLYGEYIMDDIAAPDSLGAGFRAPRKIAFVFGAHFPRLFGKRGSGRFEIYNGDREIYLGLPPRYASWSQKNLLLGSPFGPNTQAFYSRVDYRFTDQWKAIVELRDAVQYHNGLPSMGDRFELGVTAAYDITPSQSISARLISQRFRGENYTTRGTAVEVIGSYAY